MAILLLVCASIEPYWIVRDQVDVIEVNWFYGRDAKLVFVQEIYWRWIPVDGRYEVVAWRLNSGKSYPFRRGEVWVSRWHDIKDRCFREVTAPMIRYTNTQYDPEVQDREITPQNKRVKLRKSLKASRFQLPRP